MKEDYLRLRLYLEDVRISGYVVTNPKGKKYDYPLVDINQSLTPP